MQDPNYPTEQPKHAVDDALVDRNSDPAARAAAAPNDQGNEPQREPEGSRQRDRSDQSERGETF